MDNKRRGFLKIAGSGIVGAFLTKAVDLVTGTSAPVSKEEFLIISELTTQRDSLVDSIIKKNPGYVNLSQEELKALEEEGRQVLDIVFREVAHNQLTTEEMNEIVEHLSRPAEKKWTRFNTLAVGKARESFIGRVQNAIDKAKSQA
ncbi:MAG: hypothetical protein K0R29_2673 [Pseudobdellovibrio sp.]|jgi:hypothetical protein|nr:hypothetical protein [Pseudobdellovibrio sp.]